MKVSIRKDHPLTLAFVILFFLGVVSFGETESSSNRILGTVAFLACLLVAYYNQIESTIMVEDGKLKFRKKREEIELKIDEITDLSRVGRTLQVVTVDSRMTLDVSHFTSKQIRQVEREFQKQKGISSRESQ